MQPLEKDGDKKELFLLSLFQQKPTAVANAMGVFAAGWNPTSQSVPPPSWEKLTMRWTTQIDSGLVVIFAWKRDETKKKTEDIFYV